MFLSFDPVNQRLKPANNIEITLATGVPELQFFHLSFFIKFRVFVFNLLVSHMLTDASVEFIKYSELYFLFAVDFNVLCGLNGSLERGGDDG